MSDDAGRATVIEARIVQALAPEQNLIGTNMLDIVLITKLHGNGTICEIYATPDEARQLRDSLNRLLP